jgi:hypothetical protein
MEWWIYLGLVVIVIAIGGTILGMRRNKDNSPDDIYPMW